MNNFAACALIKQANGVSENIPYQVMMTASARKGNIILFARLV
jgi:CheY-like chemotaxis protein